MNRFAQFAFDALKVAGIVALYALIILIQVSAGIFVLMVGAISDLG